MWRQLRYPDVVHFMLFRMMMMLFLPLSLHTYLSRAKDMAVAGLDLVAVTLR